MEAGGESQGDEPEFVDPFDTVSDGTADRGEVEAVEPPADSQELTVSDDEIPPEPDDAQPVPLAERERRKLAAMSPEQKERYDTATAELMAMPAVKAFAEEEERARAAKKLNQEAFLAAYRKKQKEKP